MCTRELAGLGRSVRFYFIEILVKNGALFRLRISPGLICLMFNPCTFNLRFSPVSQSPIIIVKPEF